MKLRLFSLILIMLCGMACSQQLSTQQPVEPVDRGKYNPIYVPGLTEDSSRAIAERSRKEFLDKTLHRILPKTPIYNAKGKRKDLATMTQDSCMVNFVSPRCSFGELQTDELLPYCLKTRDIKVVMVITIDSIDVVDSSHTVALRKRLSVHYDDIHFMEKAVAESINATGSPTRFYFNDQGVIYFCQRGTPFEKERLCEEIDSNTIP